MSRLLPSVIMVTMRVTRVGMVILVMVVVMCVLVRA